MRPPALTRRPLLRGGFGGAAVRALAALVLGAGALIRPEPAFAQAHDLERVEPLTLSLEFGAGLLLLGGTHFLLPHPESCRWCNPPGFDEALAWPAPESQRRTVAQLSHVTSSVLVPALALSAMLVPPLVTSERDLHAFENIMIVGEAMLLDATLTVVVKRWAARQRPAFYYGRGEHTEYANDPTQQNLSFFSGDSSLPFAAAASAATVGFMRGYPSAPYVAAAGGVLSTAAAVMRVRADVHWPSDVFTGALVGTAVGIAVPLLLHPRVSASPAASEQRMLLPSLARDSAKVDFFGTF